MPAKSSPDTSEKRLITLFDQFKKPVELEIKFTMPSIVVLDEQFGIDVYQPRSYNEFPPSKVISLIYCGQLHRKTPLKRSQIPQMVPTSMELYMAICTSIALAISDAVKDITKVADGK